MTNSTRKTFKKTRAILEMAQTIHRRVKRCFEKQKAFVAERRAKLLIEYVEGEEEHLIAMVSRCLREAPADVLDTYYQFTPEEIDVLENALPSCQEPPEGMDEILATVLQFDSLMQSYYRHAAQMAPSAPVRELFENLADAVEEKERKEARNAAGLKDI